MDSRFFEVQSGGVMKEEIKEVLAGVLFTIVVPVMFWIIL